MIMYGMVGKVYGKKEKRDKERPIYGLSAFG